MKYKGSFTQARLFKGKYFDENDIEKIVAGACDILAHIGISVPDANAFARLKELGFETRENRMVIKPGHVRRFLEDTRSRLHKSQEGGQQADSHAEKHKADFEGMVSIYSYYYERPDDGEIVPFDTSSLAEMARFVEKCSRRYGFTPGVPGYPGDVPPALESLVKYKVAAENCHDGWPLEPTSRLSAKYMFEMAEVMGKPMKRLPVFMASPLCLGGDSFDILLEYKDKLESAYVFSMPAFGVTTPLSISMAFAVDLAEVLGGAILVHELTGLPVDIKPNVFPFDLRAFNVSFGSPEKFIFECMAADFSAQLLDTPLDYRSTNIHTWAKKAGIQSAVEKGTLMMAGALNGARKFYCIGTLSLDEVFSPLQLLLDLEVMKHISKVIKDFRVDVLPDNLVEIVQEGMAGGFISSDLTLDNHEEYIWYPGLFERTSLSKWLEMGRKDCMETMGELVRSIEASEVKYHLDESKSKVLNEIYMKALREI